MSRRGRFGSMSPSEMALHVEQAVSEGRLSADDPRRLTPSGELKKPKFVKFLFEDSGAYLDEIFWEDPRDYKPYKCPITGRVTSWGIYPMDKDGHPIIDPMQMYTRTMLIQLSYDSEFPKPEIQFINAVMEKKVAQLKEVDVGDLPKRDYTLHIVVEYMPEAHRIERSIRLSGGLNLAVFSDKIMKPLFGLVRNLHGHVFIDFSDGALFGPEGCNAVDMMHLDKAGHAYIPDKHYTLAHFLQKPGDVIGYTYDFGDNWHFLIELKEIHSVEESTGAVTVLSGRGAHLPDGVSSWRWREFLLEVDKSAAKRKEALEVMYDSTSYTGQRFDPHFDFDEFSVTDTQRAILAALNSKASVATGSKQFIVPLSPDFEEERRRIPNNLKKGQKIVRAPVPHNPSVLLEEGVSVNRRDNPSTTACANCGSPNNLKQCTGCKQRYYCSRSCQRANWAQGHKKDCTGKNK